MKTAEDLKKRIESTEDLQSVVKTMKAFAAVNIRQYERAVEAVEDYLRTVERGLQIVLRSGTDVSFGAQRAPRRRMGAVVFGSDQGMCGQLNEQVATHALNSMGDLGFRKEDRIVIAVGERVAGRLEDSELAVSEYFPVPSSTAGIGPLVLDTLVIIDHWGQEKEVDQVYLYYSRHGPGASYRPHTFHLLPVDERWLSRLEDEKWPSRGLPTFTMNWEPLFSALIRQYLFVSLFRAFAESLASENASRLASMQGAERNIEDQLAELNTQFHQQRQMAITEELIDIVSGFEALKQP